MAALRSSPLEPGPHLIEAPPCSGSACSTVVWVLVEPLDGRVGLVAGLLQFLWDPVAKGRPGRPAQHDAGHRADAEVCEAALPERAHILRLKSDGTHPAFGLKALSNDS